jgi:hypothetical protein
MTELQERVAVYLVSHAAIGPHTRATQDPYAWPPPPPLPTAQTLAEELLADAEFRALELGTWLSTTDGEIIAGAVSRVLPPGYEPVFSVTVDALQIAAAKQTSQGRRSAAAFAAVGLLVTYALTFGRS